MTTWEIIKASFSVDHAMFPVCWECVFIGMVVGGCMGFTIGMVLR